MKRLVVPIALLLMLVQLAPFTYAGNAPISIPSIEEWVKTGDKSMEDAKASLHRLEVQYQSLMFSIETMEETASMIVEFKRLNAIKKLGTLSSLQTDKWNRLNNMLSDEDKVMSYDAIYKNYIKDSLLEAKLLSARIENEKKLVLRSDNKVLITKLEQLSQLLGMVESEGEGRSTLEKAEKNFALVKDRYEKGLISHLDLLKGEYDYAKEVLSSQKEKRANELAMNRFLHDLQLPIDQKYELSDPFLIKPVARLQPLEAYLKDALSKHYQIESKDNLLNAYEEAMKIANRYLAYEDSEYLRLQARLLEAKNESEKIREDIELAVRSSYMEVRNAYSHYEMMRDTFEQETTRYLSSKERYEHGSISKVEFEETSKAYEEAYGNYKKARRQAILKFFKLEDAIGDVVTWR